MNIFEFLQTDMGSPLFCNVKQVGFLSSGFSCNNNVPQRPVVFTKVDPYYEWIAENAAEPTKHGNSYILILRNLQIFFLSYLLS